MKDNGKISDEDYSYLDDEDVYEEYLEPNSQIEVDEDEEVEIIEIVPPPPPFGVFPPPPAYRNFPSVDVGFEEEVEFDDGEVYEYEPEVLQNTTPSNPRKGKTVRATSSVPTAKYSDMATIRATEIADRGEEQARRISTDDTTSKIVSFFKILAGIACVFAMMALCFVFVYWQYSKVSQESAIANDSSSSVSAWKLPPSVPNDIIQYFYNSLGEMSSISEYRDMLVKGTLELNGKTEDFYCIRRANGNCYVKIGSIENERAYYISSDSDGVFRLIDMRANGRREAVSTNESLTLKALANFDENMFKLAFGSDVRVIGSTSTNFSYVGKSNINGVPVDVLKYSHFGTEYKYCFSTKDTSLLSTTMTQGQSSVTVEYSDYQNTNTEMKFPFARKILLNGKPLGSVLVKVALVNKGFVIP